MTKKKGFTLIELLVVISIIALLLSIMMPGLQNARKIAQQVVCSSLQRQLTLGTFMYAQDNRDTNYDIIGTGQWYTVYEPYYTENPEVLLCPSANRPAMEDGHQHVYPAGWEWLGSKNRAWGRAPQNAGMKAGFTSSYGINIWIASPPDDYFIASQPIRGKPADYWRSNNRVRMPSQVPIFLDAFWFGAHADNTQEPPRYEDDKNSLIARFCLDRHRGGISASFVDGTSRRVGLKELWTLKWNVNSSPSEPEWPLWMQKF